MAIHFPSGGPENTFDLMLRVGWDDVLLSLPRNAARSLDEFRADLKIGPTFNVFYPTIDEVERGTLAGPETRYGWRNLLIQGKQVLAQIEAGTDNQPLAIHTGPAKDGIVQALQSAEALPGEWHVMAVESPVLKFCALLARPAVGPALDEDSYVIPYAPDMTDLPDYTAIPFARAIATLRGLADAIPVLNGNGDAIG